MKLSLGKTPEEQAAEEAKKQRERELEIQRANLERQQKVEALRSKQKINTIIVLGTSGVLAIALLVFGTYNTFFKKDLSIDDVKNQIYSQVIAYPSEGLDNYIRDISQKLFDEHIGFDGNKYVSANIDKNSVYISRVKKTNNIFSQVYFMADVVMTERDSRVTDPEILGMLRKGGLKIDTSVNARSVEESLPSTNDSSASSSMSLEETKQLILDILNEEQLDQLTQSLLENVSSEQAQLVMEFSSDKKLETLLMLVDSDTTISLFTQLIDDEQLSQFNDFISKDNNSNTNKPDDNSNEDTTPNSAIVGNVELGTGDSATEYYLLSNGDYMQKGKKTTQRYTFMIPVEYYYNYNEQNVAISSGYKTAGKLELYSLVEVDNFSESDAIHSYYAFNKDYAVDAVTLESARQTVNKILSDIYAGTVLPQDFVNARKFNTYGASYVRLDAFEFYNATNPLGYNAVTTYTIKLPQGFLYTTTTYLTVEPNNTTWKITNMT